MSQLIKMRHGVQLLTVSSVNGQDIEYIGLVTGQSVLGANVFRDIMASITDFLGGRSRSYERPLATAMENALDDIAKRAAQAGANAVIALELDTNQIRVGMLMCSATGTAVRLSKSSY